MSFQVLTPWWLTAWFRLGSVVMTLTAGTPDCGVAGPTAWRRNVSPGKGGDGSDAGVSKKNRGWWKRKFARSNRIGRSKGC